MVRKIAGITESFCQLLASSLAFTYWKICCVFITILTVIPIMFTRRIPNDVIYVFNMSNVLRVFMVKDECRRLSATLLRYLWTYVVYRIVIVSWNRRISRFRYWLRIWILIVCKIDFFDRDIVYLPIFFHIWFLCVFWYWFIVIVSFVRCSGLKFVFFSQKF